MYQNRTGKLSTIDLWYDYPNGRNLNLIQKQLGVLTHDVEYTNGTSFYYELEQGTCKKITFAVGILRPDWLSGATYIGTENIDGFKCNVWEKVDFIRYWEDVESQRPVSWLFLSSRKPCSPLLLFNSSCCGRVWMKICGPCSILFSSSNSGPPLTNSQKYLEKENFIEFPHYWRNEYIKYRANTSKL